MRSRKIATRLMRKGLQVLKDENCDVACMQGSVFWDAETVKLDLEARSIIERIEKANQQLYRRR